MNENEPVRISEFFAPISTAVDGFIISGEVLKCQVRKNPQTGQPKYIMEIYTGDRVNWNVNVSRITPITNNWGSQIDFARSRIAFAGRVTLFNGNIYFQDARLIYSEALDDAEIVYDLPDEY